MSQVISGQHLPRSGGTEFDVDHDIVDPYVEVTLKQVLNNVIVIRIC